LTEVKKKARSDAGLFCIFRSCVVGEVPFASRLAPTFEMHSPVGASLLAKTPELLTENYLEETR
jgi:hypothetical protein